VVPTSDRRLGQQVSRLRSTQFDDHFRLHEEPEDRRGRSELNNTLCETIKRLGFARNNQVKLYGEIFELVSDPVIVGDHLVFVDALKKGSSKVLRVRIPPVIVRMARIKRRAI